MRYFCFQHNIEDRLADGRTLYGKRFEHKFPHKTFSFGAEIKYKPSSPAFLNQMHPCGDKRLLGIFIGYYLEKGGYYSSGIMVADWEDFAHAERVNEIHLMMMLANFGIMRDIVLRDIRNHIPNMITIMKIFIIKLIINMHLARYFITQYNTFS